MPGSIHWGFVLRRCAAEGVWGCGRGGGGALEGKVPQRRPQKRSDWQL